MTTAISIEDISRKVADAVPGSMVATDQGWLALESSTLARVADFISRAPGLEFDYLTVVTAVDYLTYFELIYRVVSMKHNHSLVMKTRCYDRENPEVPSVTPVWRAAYYQEREIYDLLGIRFAGHPNLKRLFLWEGFNGHPLRRDYL